jgi:hypothetical protein
MSNTLLTPTIIARQALLILQTEMVSLGLAYRDKSSEFTGAKVGDTIKVRRPATFAAQEFTSTVDPQAITEREVELTLEKHYDITVNVTSKDWTLRLEDFSEQVLRPIIVGHLEAASGYLLGKYHQVYQYYDAASAAFPSTIAHIAQVGRVLDNAKVPMRDRVCIVSPEEKAALLGIEAFHAADKRGDSGTALREASMGRVLGFDWFMDQLVPTHIKGTFAGSPAINGAVLEGATTMAIDGGSGTQTVKKGDLFKVADVPGQYVVTADAAAVDGAIAAVAFSPAAPAGGFPNDKAISFVASHRANLAMHPAALAVAMVPLELPRGAANARIVSANGVGLRYVASYNTSTKTDQISLDYLIGAKFVQPELAARVPAAIT